MKSLNAEGIDNGIYKVFVTFNDGPVFEDILIKESSQKSSFTVPGNFTKTIQLNEQGESLSFLLEAKEFGQDFKFEFKAKMKNKDATEISFIGFVYDFNSQKQIGKFKGEKLHESNQCFSGYHHTY
jgi:hypothetical protein